MTFDEIRIRSVRAAQNLQARGYKPREFVTVMVKHPPNVVPIVFASIAIGCPISILDNDFDRALTIHKLKLIKPVLVFCDTEYYQSLNDCLLEVGCNTKVFTFGASVCGSEPVENLFKETQKEDQFM